MSVSEVKSTNENSLPQRLRRYFDQTRSELKKVVWPSREETNKLTAIVLAVTVAMALLLGSIDALFAYVFSLLVR